MLDKLLEHGGTLARVIERLYLATLSRQPHVAEQERTLAHVQRHADNVRQAYADILWALLNTSEFTLNH